MGSISFFAEDVSFQPKQKVPLKKWLKNLCSLHDFQVGEIQFIYCSDSYLFQLNRQYLQHDTFTDIITFDYSAEKIVSGDIFISIDRVTENAKKFSHSFEDELHRVMAHGVLHLMGFKDKSPKTKLQMTSEEDKALLLRADYF